MKYTFRNKTVSITKRSVEKVLKLPPDATVYYVVDIRGRLYPVKQAFAVGASLRKTTKFNSSHAQEALKRLGYKVIDVRDCKRNAR